jgi:hypothetical protein
MERKRLNMRMIDMAITPEERKEDMPAIADANPENMPKYPYGLAIRFDDESLKKLEADTSDWEVGDSFELVTEVKVTSKSEHDTNDGKKCCVELQIVAIGAPEMEGEEEHEEEAEHKDGKEENEPPNKKGRPNYYF